MQLKLHKSQLPQQNWPKIAILMDVDLAAKNFKQLSVINSSTLLYNSKKNKEINMVKWVRHSPSLWGM